MSGNQGEMGRMGMMLETLDTRVPDMQPNMGTWFSVRGRAGNRSTGGADVADSYFQHTRGHFRPGRMFVGRLGIGILLPSRITYSLASSGAVSFVHAASPPGANPAKAAIMVSRCSAVRGGAVLSTLRT